MKKLKRVLFLVLTISILISKNENALVCKASNSQKSNKEYLMRKGYPEEVLDNYNEKELKLVADSIKRKNGKNTIEWSMLEVDNLEELQEVVNTPNDKLKKYGMSDRDIASARKEVIVLRNKSDSYLKKQYDLTDVEVRYLRRALTENKKYHRKDINKKAQLSGTISSSKLSFSMLKTVNSSKKPNYTIKVSYNWLNPYYLEAFSDKIAVAWGGGLNVKSIDSNAKYYKIKGLAPNYKYNGYKTSKDWSYTERPQKGVVFTAKQSTNNGLTTTRMKSGYVKFTLYQDKFKGYSTNCVAQYGHKQIGIGNVNISATPSVSITGSYDRTNTIKRALKY